jgi:hypothetical protein
MLAVKGMVMAVALKKPPKWQRSQKLSSVVGAVMEACGMVAAEAKSVFLSRIVYLYDTIRIL